MRDFMKQSWHDQTNFSAPRGRPYETTVVARQPSLPRRRRFRRVGRVKMATAEDYDPSMKAHPSGFDKCARSAPPTR